MSYILRHGAQKEGLAMRADGYIALNDLLQVQSMKKHRVTPAIIDYIVANNDKKRYQLTEEQGVRFIRAVQGHTMDTVENE